MKKIALFLTISLLMVCLLVGCADKPEGADTLGVTNETASPSPSTLETGEPQESATPSPSADPTGADGEPNWMEADNSPEFWQFVDMLLDTPEGYLDQTVTVSGEYTGYFDDYYGRYIHYLLQMDEMGCCPLFMEFMMDNSISPDDYPEENAQIEATGVYKSYYDEGIDWTNYYVQANSIAVLDGGVSE